MPYVRVRRKPKRRYLTVIWLASAGLLFAASAAFYAQDGKPKVPGQLPPTIPGMGLPQPGQLPAGAGFASNREELPMPNPTLGRGQARQPELLPPAIVRPVKPDATERPNTIEGGIIQATYRELSGRKDVVFLDRDRGAFAKPIGTLNWDMAGTKFVNGGLENQFRTYCCEPFVSVSPGKTYQFRFDPIDRPEFFSQPNDDIGQVITIQRVKYVRELYGKHYEESVANSENAAAAFQAALWELVAESPVGPDRQPDFSLFQGTFRTTFGDPAEAPAYVKLGEKYLKGLTGDDKAFIENPKFEQYELVRLTGMPGDDDTAPQSQIAVRLRTDSGGLGGTGGGNGTVGSGSNGSFLLASASGGLGGSPLNKSPLAAGGLGTGGIPALGGGGGFGGGGGNGSGGSGTDGGGNGSSGGTGGTGGTGFPGGTGGTGTGGTGGTGGNPDDTGGGVVVNPVPAPPAILLALAGVGVLGGGAFFRRKK